MTQLDVITTPDALREIAPDWDAALVRDGGLECALTSHWLINYLEAFGTGTDARILCVRDDAGAVIGQAAFMGSKQRGMPVLSSLTNLYANRSTIVGTQAGLDAIGTWIAGQSVGLVRIGRSAPSETLHKLVPNSRVSQSYDLPVISTDTDMEAYLAAKSGNFRKSLKRAKTKHEGFRAEFLKRPQDHIDDMLSVSRKTWKFDAGTAITSDPSVQRFFTGLATAGPETGPVQPVLLLIYDEADQPVAFAFMLLFNAVLFGLKLGHDPDISDRYPGFAILNVLTQYAFEQDEVALIDLDAVGPHGEYKVRWATEMRHLENVVGFPNTAAGFVGRGAWTMRGWLRDVKAAAKSKTERTG
ncbi:MAG: GNAT family N-acetyltransferase [Pseudomonadota bacterium]